MINPFCLSNFKKS